MSKYQTHSRLSIYGEEDILEMYLKIRCVGSRMQEQVGKRKAGVASLLGHGGGLWWRPQSSL